MRNLNKSLKVVDYPDDVCIMDNMEATTTTQGATTMTATFTITEDHPSALSLPWTFEATLETATARFNERAAVLGQTDNNDWTLTLWSDNEVLGFTQSTLLEEASFVSQATLDATARRIAKNEAMKAKMANYYNLSDVLARGDEAGRA
ncbi:MAG: hypothetical protein DRH08_05660 [Deltaproteobacteria bacterium]|nr:MAG: hypothetical protein DRH08_05660 [Deltaproteobacteria bacterium]